MARSLVLLSLVALAAAASPHTSLLKALEAVQKTGAPQVAKQKPVTLGKQEAAKVKVAVQALPAKAITKAITHAAVQSLNTAKTPVVVPAPADANKDGFPELPAVSHMLLAAASTVKTVSSQASALEAKVAQAEQLNEAKMMRTRNLFQKKLETQETANRKLVDTNTEVSQQIDALKRGIDALLKRQSSLKATNHVMLSELHLMKSKLAIATSFVDATTAISADKKGAVSLLQLSSEPALSPDSILDGIMKDITNLKQQTKKSETSLKARFMSDYRVGSKRRAALLLQHKELIASWTSLKDQQSELQQAETHLVDTRDQLQHRLNNLGAFLQNLADLAAAPVAKVPALLKSIPQKVAA